MSQLKLESRMELLEATQSRVAELEERVDFAERLLTQTSSEHKLQAGGPA